MALCSAFSEGAIFKQSKKVGNGARDGAKTVPEGH